MDRRNRWLMGGMIVCLAMLLVSGCRKAPTGNTSPTPPAPVNPQPAPVNPPPTVQGGSGIGRADHRVVSGNRLRQIGIAYTQAAIGGKVSGPADLGKDIQLIDGRQIPFEIVWGVDLDKATSANPQMLLAWEKEPDVSQTRQALRVDGSVVRLSEDEFQKAVRAKP